VPYVITFGALRWPTTAAQVFPHGKGIASKVAAELAKDVQASIWVRSRFLRWTGRSYEAWKGEGTATGGVRLWNNAQNRKGVPYVPYVHLTRTPPSKVLVIDVRALAVSKWMPIWAERLRADLAGPKGKAVVIRG